MGIRVLVFGDIDLARLAVKLIKSPHILDVFVVLRKSRKDAVVFGHFADLWDFDFDGHKKARTD